MRDHHALGRLAIELSQAASFEQSVSQVVDFAAQTFDADLAGVTAVDARGRLETVGPTDPVVREADELQARWLEGPGFSAPESTHTVSNDVGADPRWTRWGSAVAAMGIGSLLSVELQVGSQRFGALTVYGPVGRVFSRSDVETAQVLAYHASAALQSVRQVEGLTIALDTRTVIGQAQGILMERYKVDSERAFTILRRHSQQENVRLSRLARDLVETFERGAAAGEGPLL